MSGNPTNEQIMEALTASGYLMEQHVATQLEKLGFHVRTNVPFEDQDEGKSREIDVTAIKQIANNEEAKVSAFVELIVECKNNKNPFVFITRPKNEEDLLYATAEHFRYPIRYDMKKTTGPNIGMTREVRGFYHLGFADVHYGHLSRSKAVQFCRIDRDKKDWHANHGGLYDAIFYPMAKAVLARLAEVRNGKGPDQWKYLWLAFPLIVTTGDLLSVDSTENAPVPRPQQWVRFSRGLKSGKLTGRYDLDFVRQDSLEEFVRNCIQPLANLAIDLAENKAAFLLSALTEWKD